MSLLLYFLTEPPLKPSLIFQVATIVSKLKGYSICIGVKKLLGLLDMVKQMEPKGRLIRLLNKLEEENFAVPSGTAM